MAEKAKTGTTGAGNADANKPGLEGLFEPLTDAGRKAAENSATISLKMIEHAEANSRDAFAAMRAAATAGSLAEVLRIQGEYIREQGARNMTMAREVGDLIVQLGKRAIDSDGDGK